MMIGGARTLPQGLAEPPADLARSCAPLRPAAPRRMDHGRSGGLLAPSQACCAACSSGRHGAAAAAQAAATTPRCASSTHLAVLMLDSRQVAP